MLSFALFLFFSAEQFVEPRSPLLMFEKKKNLPIISRPRTYLKINFEKHFFNFIILFLFKKQIGMIQVC